MQKPHPPIWVGGESPVALRRAGRLADAWYPIGSNPRFPVGTPVRFADVAASVKRHAQEAGPGGAPARRPAAPLDRHAAQIADDIKRYADVGVRHMMVNLQGDTLEQTLARMRRFADRIMPLTR